MKKEDRFTSRVSEYAQSRPSYPIDSINYLLKKGINKNSVIADIGSGTGILSKLLINEVKEIFMVEPNSAMREYSKIYLSKNDNCNFINGNAENTTLKDNSIDAIVVAQAFHWFDIEKCKIEFNRILKPNSNIFLIWNNRLKNTTFLQKYDEILKTLSVDYNEVNHQNLSAKDFGLFFDNNWKIQSFDNYQIFNFEQFIKRVFSSSYTPNKKDKNFSVFYNAIKKLFNEENINGFVRFNYNTEIYSKY